MIKIKYERYYDDHTRKQNLTKTFVSLEELKGWIHSITVGDINSDRIIWWPHYKESKLFRVKIGCGWQCWIRLIENEEGIIFTDGHYTSGKLHSSQQFYERCQHQIKIQKQAQYKFVD